MKETITYSLFFSAVLTGVVMLSLGMKMGFSEMEFWWAAAFFSLFFLITALLLGTIQGRTRCQLKKMDEELAKEQEEE